MRTLKSLDELDGYLARCDAAKSDDELRSIFTEFRMEAPGAPSDPFSEEYRAFQDSLYRQISGREYSLENEGSLFDVEAAIISPFPYSTRSPATTGDQLIAIGFLLRSLKLAPGARVLEFGPGWGNTTLAMAQLGFDVTAIDVEPKFAQLIQERARRLGVRVNALCDDFFFAGRTAEKFDLILFYECFHHCSDHLRLLEALHRPLSPGGKVIFAGEPIDSAFPRPWGLRMDGQSLWSIRKFGWLELGFSPAYFRQALAAKGWRATVSVSQDVPWQQVWTAQRRSEPMIFPASSPQLATLVGTRTPAGIELSGAKGFGVFGPYTQLDAGQYRATIEFSRPASGVATVSVCAGGGTNVLAERPLLATETQSTTIEFALNEAVEDLEVRLFCDHEFRGAISGLRIQWDWPTGSPIAQSPASSSHR